MMSSAKPSEYSPLHIVPENSSNRKNPSKASWIWYSPFVIVFFLTGGLLWSQRTPKQTPPDLQARPMTSIILTADSGSMVGTSEGGEIKAQMVGAYSREEDNESTFCVEVLHGNLFGSQVMLVTTGIGHDRAALCLRSLLTVYHKTTKEILFLGTGGFSPAVGGILNSEDCNAPTRAEKADLVPLGSVCVSPLTTNWDCHKCVWPAAVDSACMDSGCTLHDRSDLFGNWGCNYYSTCNLADEVIAASSSGDELELPPPLLFEMESEFWGAMSNGTGEAYLQRIGDMRPKVYDYSTCAEATSNTFWVGSPYEELARSYVAGVINDAFSSELYKNATPAYFAASASRGVTKRDVLAVSAMEGAGWMEVLALEEVFLKYSRIDAVNIRGAADYVVPPLQRRNDGTWEELSSFSENLKGGDALTTEGYDFAIKSTSALVLNLFRAREGANAV